MNDFISVVISTLVSSIVSGYEDRVSSCILSIYPESPFETEKIRAMPIIPMLPANEVRAVLPFLVNRFLSDRLNAVVRDIDGFFSLRLFFLLLSSACFSSSAFLQAVISSSVKGIVSPVISPSRTLIILVEYFAARSGLWVTIIIRRSLEISFNISITCTLVSVSRAPVGSSASIISGLFTNALAIATRCICPPDISLGFLLIWFPRPTFSRASLALCFLSDLLTPESVRANSTF